MEGAVQLDGREAVLDGIRLQTVHGEFAGAHPPLVFTGDKGVPLVNEYTNILTLHL